MNEPSRRFHRSAIIGTLSLAIAIGSARTSSAEVASDEPDSSTILQIEALVREAEHSHPAILAARARAAADAERPSQLGAMPDPTIGAAASNFRVDDPTLSSSPMAGVELRFRQPIPFPGKLDRRRATATAQAEASSRLAQEVVLDVETNVRARYWELAGAREVERITRANLNVLDELIDIANSRLAVGMGAQQDVLQAQAALGELQSQLLFREQQTRNAVRELNVAVGRAADSPPIPTKSYEVAWSPILNRKQLGDATDELNPRLAVRRAEVATAEQGLSESLRDRWPDFAIGGGYRIRETIDGGASDGGDMFFVSLDMSIPLYAKAKQNRRVDEMRARLTSARHAETDLHLRVMALASNLADEVERLIAQASLFDTQVLPQDRFALDASISDYSVGSVNFVSVLTNWQAVLRDEIALEQIKSTLGVRVAELEFVAGRSLQ